MFPLAFLQNMGVFEWMVILIVALLIFGHKLPSLARSLGSSVNEFKKGAREGEQEATAAEAEKVQLSQIKCGACGTTYLPEKVGAPCPGCGNKPGTPAPTSVAEKK